MERRSVWPEGHWSWPIDVTHKHGTRVDEMIFVGGQVDLDSAGTVRHPDDIVAQTAEAMAYLDRVLRDLDADLIDLAKLVAYYVSSDPAEETVFLEAIARALPDGAQPAVSLLPLPALAYPGLVVEIEAVAMRAPSGERLPRRYCSADGLYPLPAPFCHALACGDMIFTSDVLPVDAKGEVLAPDDVVEQSRIMMERLGEVLGRLGAVHDDVVKINVFYIGVEDPVIWAKPALIRASFFSEPGPAATGIPLPYLGREGLMTRIAVTAMRGADGKQLSRRYSWPEGHWDWPNHLPYKHANHCGKMIHMGGQVSLDGQGETIDRGDMAAQTRRAMDYIAKALREVGADMDDVVKVTAFYQGSAHPTELHDNLSIRSSRFSDPGPSSTGIPVPYLAFGEMLIEIEVTAMIPESS